MRQIRPLIMFAANCKIAQLQQTTEILQQCWEIVILIA